MSHSLSRFILQRVCDCDTSYNPQKRSKRRLPIPQHEFGFNAEF